jgi:hypothetical protein
VGVVEGERNQQGNGSHALSPKSGTPRSGFGNGRRRRVAWMIGVAPRPSVLGVTARPAKTTAMIPRTIPALSPRRRGEFVHPMLIATLRQRHTNQLTPRWPAIRRQRWTAPRILARENSVAFLAPDLVFIPLGQAVSVD